MAAKRHHYLELPPVFQDTEIIADPLNRLISISKFEKRIICCPEFQRLRRIKQLGFAHFVYPAAEYSRFTHSLGVCHQAKQIVDIVNTNLENDPRYQSWRVYGRNTENPVNGDLFITPSERVVIAAAGLLHDLPHGPFSHDLEGILTEEGETLIPDHDKLAENPALFLYLFDTSVSEIAMLLEHFNEEFFSPLIKEIRSAKPQLTDNWRESLHWLMEHRVLTSTGMIRVGIADSPLQFAKKDEILPDGKFTEVPFLAAVIFEVLLFEKQNEWLSPKEISVLRKEKKKEAVEVKEWGLIVKTDWRTETRIRWQPIPGWFRAYRKDIIGNTICADLIDYVNRDGYHTGIVSTIDLKFLDRMTILRAVLPATGPDGETIRRPPSNTIDYEDIPISCEHIVFDVYDHKRGFIRQSVLTEILAYLQARYLLCERVYNHRVVEAARSMVQKIILILGSIKLQNGAKKLLELSDVHPLNGHGPGDPLAPIGDEAFLNWVRALPESKPDIHKTHPNEIDDAVELATLLQERRIFREAIIYDGLHGFILPGNLAGAEKSCKALEAAFLTDPAITGHLKGCLEEVSQSLAQAFAQKTKGITSNYQRLKPRIKCLVGVRKWGKRYKPPLVLIARPLKYPEAKHGSFDVEPLLDCEDPSNIKKHLDALKASYDSLWKVYLFLHPVFHGRLFLDQHYAVQTRLNAFAAQYTGIKWKNAIAFEQLLSELLDNALFLAKPERMYFANHLVPTTLERLLTEFTRIATEVLPNDLSRFSDAVQSEGFKARVNQELLKAETQEKLEAVISKAPTAFRNLALSHKAPDPQKALVAREAQTLWLSLILMAISQASDESAQTELGLI